MDTPTLLLAMVIAFTSGAFWGAFCTIIWWTYDGLLEDDNE